MLREIPFVRPPHSGAKIARQYRAFGKVNSPVGLWTTCDMMPVPAAMLDIVTGYLISAAQAALIEGILILLKSRLALGVCLLSLWLQALGTPLSRPFFGASVQDVTGSIELASGFTISPDSRFVVFTADFNNDGAAELYRAAVDGTNTARIGLADGFDVDNDLDFSPNGRFLQFQAEAVATENDAVFVVRLDLDNQPTPINVSALITDMTDASAFTSIGVADNQSLTFYILGDVAGTPLQRIVTVPVSASANSLAVGAPVIIASGALLGDSLGILWGRSPVTNQVVYNQSGVALSGRESGLFSVPASGGGASRLDSITIESDGGVVIDAGLSAIPDEISPNGQVVLYQRAQSEAARNNDQYDLYAVPIDGGTPRRLNASLGERRIVGLRLLGGSRTMNQQGNLAYYLLSPTTTSDTQPVSPVLSAIGDLYTVPTRPEFGPLAARTLLTNQVLFLQDILFRPGTNQLIYTASTGDPNAPGSVRLLRDGVAISNMMDERQRYVKQLRVTNDGERVVFVAGAEAVGGIDHVFAHEFESGQTTLLASASEANPIFTIAIDVTPDGRRVILGFPIQPTGGGLDSFGTMELFSVPVTGGALNQITPDLIDGGLITPNFQSSPDSEFVVYRANQDDTQLRELFRAETGVNLLFSDGFESP